MAVKVDCAWARVCIRESKRFCSIEKNPGEGSLKFRARVIDDRYRVYCEHFKEHPLLHISKHDFVRVYKIIDDKFSNWRNKSDKEAYLTQFSTNNWNDGKVLSKEGKKEHSLSSCKACFLFNSQFQSTFPLSKNCRVATKGPLGDLQANAKRKIGQEDPHIMITNKKLKSVGKAIFAAYNETCKENFGKSLSDILVLVPEAGLEKRLSPVEKRKLKRDQQRQLKHHVEKQMAQADTDVHLSLCESYSARKTKRLAQAFETFEEAQERAKKTPPKVKERLHTPLTENIDGNLQQLLAEVDSWPDGKVNWSEKARSYKIRTKGQESTPANGGQLIKFFLQSKGVNITRFEPRADNDNQEGRSRGKNC